MTKEDVNERAGKVPWWKRHLKALGAAGVIGLLALIQQVTGFTLEDIWPVSSGPQATAAPTAVGPSTTSEPGKDETGSPTPSASATATSNPPTAVSSSTSRPQSVVPSNALSSIVVVSEMTTTTYGKVVGKDDNLYQMANGWGYIQVAYGWSGLRADGTEVNSDSCQILVTIKGPQSIPSMRYGQCTNLETGFFKAEDNKLKISAPGLYEVTVKDEKTGVAGTGTFTVLGE